MIDPTDPYAGYNFRPLEVIARPWPEFCEEVLQIYAPGLRSPKTRTGMAYALRVLGGLGIETTADLTVSLVGRLVVSRPEANSPNSTRALLRYVQVACNYAFRYGYLRVSPFVIRPLASWVRPAPPRGKKHASREEIRKVMELFAQKANATGWRGWKAKREYTLFATLALTGMRAGEAYWLQVQDVDLAAGVILIVSRKSHRTKTAHAAAPIPMPRQLIPILRDWIENHRLSRPPGSEIAECPWLFPTTHAIARSPWVSGVGPSRPRARIMAVAAEAGVLGLNPSMLRHSWCTHFLTSWGGAPGVAKRILRHTTENTQRWYTHDDIPGLRDAIRDVEY